MLTQWRIWGGGEGHAAPLIPIVEGDTTRTRSQFENELNKIKVQFARIRNKNVIFVLCQFRRFVLYLQKEFWVSILKLTQNEINVFVPNSRELYLILI